MTTCTPKMGVLLLLSLLSLVPLTSSAWEKDKVYHLTILHTNDHHGHFWPNDIGEYGLAAQKTVVDRVRTEVAAQGGSLLLLSGGDINTGVPESDIQNAEPDFKGMASIGYDAMAVGNHEFDNDIATIREQERWANFPFLSANIYAKQTGTRVFSPYALFNQQGLKIAVIGLTTDDTPILADVKNTQDFEFRSPANEAKQVIADINQQQAPDLIFAVTHMGHYDDGQHGSMAAGDVELARSLPVGALAMIIGGHSQNPVCMANSKQKIVNYVPGTPCAPDKQNGTWIVQAHEWGKYVGRADFTFKNGQLTLEHYQLIPINLKKEVENSDGSKKLAFYTESIAADEAMVKLLTPYQNKGQQQLLVVIGQLQGRLEGERAIVRSQQTNLGQLLLAAFIEKTNADIGIMTGGMIRDTLIEGNITYRDLLKVEPFGNTVVYADLTGQHLLDYLTVAANKKAGAGAFAHFANLNIIMDGDKISSVKVKGVALDLNQTYRLATLNFLAAGGDGYPTINTLPSYVDTGFMDADVLRTYFEKHSPIIADKFTPVEVIRQQ